jgi:hypothetical protein
MIEHPCFLVLCEPKQYSAITAPVLTGSRVDWYYTRRDAVSFGDTVPADLCTL